DAASKLCGAAGMKELGNDLGFRHPIMAPEMIRQLPRGHALVIRLGYSPAIARPPMAWDNRAHKRAPRDGPAVTALTPAPPPQAPPLAGPGRGRPGPGGGSPLGPAPGAWPGPGGGSPGGHLVPSGAPGTPWPWAERR